MLLFRQASLLFAFRPAHRPLSLPCVRARATSGVCCKLPTLLSCKMSSGVGQAEAELGAAECGVGATHPSSQWTQPELQKHTQKLRISTRKVKTRQHVNPLAAQFQRPATLPEGWFKHHFADPTAPLLVDIGCGRGTFAIEAARINPARNYLGLEIRRPIAALCLTRAARLKLQNCHFLCCNVNVDLARILTHAAECGASVDMVTLQFPDPCFKTKHHKRRMLQPELVKVIQSHLRVGGTLFMQSDILDMLEDMRLMVREEGGLLVDCRDDLGDWMEGPENNPLGTPTEREVATYAKSEGSEKRVYRCMFVKRAETPHPPHHEDTLDASKPAPAPHHRPHD